jgi:hypothetical protein
MSSRPLLEVVMPRRSSFAPARPARLARTLVVTGLLAAGVAGAGCGSSSPGSASAGSSAVNKQNAARVKLTQCLRDQGVNVPDNPGAGGGAGGGGGAQLTDSDRQKLRTAIQGPCKQYQSQAFGNITDAQRQAFRDALTKFSACMRQHGVDLPDPGAGGNAGPPAGANRLDQSDPKVKAATTACRDKLPQNGPGGGRGLRGGAAQ